MKSRRCYDPFKKIQPFPELEFFQCTDRNCPRCHGAVSNLIPTPNLPVDFSKDSIDRSVFPSREITCIKARYLRQGPADPRTPEEDRISRELRSFTIKERRIHNG